MSLNIEVTGRINLRSVLLKTLNISLKSFDRFVFSSEINGDSKLSGLTNGPSSSLFRGRNKIVFKGN